MTSTDQTKVDSGWLATILAVGAWITQNSSAIGRTWAEWTRGVTNVKTWVNETDHEIEVWKLDGGYRRRDHFRVPPRQTVHIDMWISWADDPDQYADHHVIIQVGGAPLAYIWQSGPVIRFNTSDEFVDGGVPVPGAAGAGGDRTMVVGQDLQGRIGFALGIHSS
jgi:hypothetical protein